MHEVLSVMFSPSILHIPRIMLWKSTTVHLHIHVLKLVTHGIKNLQLDFKKILNQQKMIYIVNGFRVFASQFWIFFFKLFRFETNLLILNTLSWNAYAIRKFLLFSIKIISNYINCAIYLLFFDDWNTIITVLKGTFHWFNFGNQSKFTLDPISL